MCQHTNSSDAHSDPIYFDTMSPTESSFSTGSGYVDVGTDAPSETSSLKASDEVSEATAYNSYQEKILQKIMEAMDAKLLDSGRAAKETDLARCVVELVQANERLNERLVLEANNRVELNKSLKPDIEHLKKQVKDLQESSKTVNEEKIDLERQLSEIQGKSQKIRQEYDEFKRIKLEEIEKMTLAMNGNGELEAGIAKSNKNDPKGPLVDPPKPYGWKISTDIIGPNSDYSSELLDCPLMKSGVYRWSILVEEDPFLGLGVASAKFSPHVWLWHQGPNHWRYYSGGKLYHNNQHTGSLAKYGKGSKIIFLLDLTEDGTLLASVDGKPFRLACSSMLATLKEVGPEGGFLPAAWMNRTKIQFLGFETVAPCSDE